MFVWSASSATFGLDVAAQLQPDLDRAAVFAKDGWLLLGGAWFSETTIQQDVQHIVDRLFVPIDDKTVLINPGSPSMTFDGCRSRTRIDVSGVLREQFTANAITGQVRTGNWWDLPPLLHNYRPVGRSGHGCFTLNSYYVRTKRISYEICTENSGQSWQQAK